MRVVLSKTGRYVAKLSLQVVPSVTASVLGGYLLAQLHVSKDTPGEPAARVTGVSVQDAHGSVPLAEVKPIPPKLIAPKPAEPKSAEAKPAEGKAAEGKAARAKPVASPATAVAEREKQEKIAEKPARQRTNVAAINARPPESSKPEAYKPIPFEPEPSTQSLYVAPPAEALAEPSLTAHPAPPARTAKAVPPIASPVAAPAQPSSVADAQPPAAPQLPPPTTLSSVDVVAPAPVASTPADAPQVVVRPRQVAREEGRDVFSTISSAAGTAANATGDTINWVFGLPGKLIGRGDDAESDSASPERPPVPRRLM